MDDLQRITDDPRVTVRRGGSPDPAGTCVVYWMQRAQRGVDNPALDAAVEAANALGKPAVVFFAPIPFYPRANLRHYRFLAEGIPDIAASLNQRKIGFVLRRFPEHSLVKFCAEVKAALVVGDENPMREPEAWRATAAKKLDIPLWTVDADVVVPSKLLEKAQYSAHIIRPRLRVHLGRFLVPPKNVEARVAWKKPESLSSLDPEFDITAGWPLDTSTGPVSSFLGGTNGALRLLDDFVKHGLTTYGVNRNKPEVNGTSRLSPFLHFGHISPITVALAVEKADAPKPDKDAFLDQLITQRIPLEEINRGFDDLKAGRAIRSVIVFGDAV